MNTPTHSPSPGPIRLLLVDAHDISRSSSRVLLDALPGLFVVGEAGDKQQALALANEHRPDIVLMSMRIRESSGSEMIRLLLQGFPGLRVVILTLFDSPEYVQAALDAGASAYVLKEAPSSDVLTAIERVMAGSTFLSAGLKFPGKGAQ